jgi:hypothetical protein
MKAAKKHTKKTATPIRDLGLEVLVDSLHSIGLGPLHKPARSCRQARGQARGESASQSVLDSRGEVGAEQATSADTQRCAEGHRVLLPRNRHALHLSVGCRSRDHRRAQGRRY